MPVINPAYIMSEEPKRLIDILLKPSALGKLLGDYLGLGRWRRSAPINTAGDLQYFLNTRASFVAQTSLYGYLRTRAGMRYPELFDDDVFVASINIAKWQIWLACLSDLSVYSGGLLMQHPGANARQVAELLQSVVNAILDEAGVPDEAGSEYSANAEHVRQRVATCDWVSVTDDEAPFSESPPALVKWAPIVEDLKQLDEGIVINSVRFRWQKVRRDLRSALRAEQILTALK